MGVTIKDVAKKTGVSVTTVSLVLNNKNSRISEKTRQLIEQAAREMNYIPNQSAVSLVTKKTNLIGVVVPSENYYEYSDFVRSMEYACKNSGYYMNLMLSEPSPEALDKQIRDLMRYNVDGIILDPSLLSEPSDLLTELISSERIPIISIGKVNNTLLENSISPLHRKGIYKAARHLLELGHTSIGLITGPGSLSITDDMIQGYREALESFEIPFDEYMIYCDSFSTRTGKNGLKQLLSRSVTAIITASDTLAFGAYSYASQHKIQIPEDLSLVCYGGGSLIENLSLPLTSVSIHLDRIARKSVNLIRHYQGKVPAELIEPTLIQRGSTGPCRSSSD